MTTVAFSALPALTGGYPYRFKPAGWVCPSLGIVVEELAMLGAKCVIRIGTTGGLAEGMEFADTIVATAAWGQKPLARKITGSEDYNPTPSPELLMEHVRQAERLGKPFHLGPIRTTDRFYENGDPSVRRQAELGCLGVEMEAAALFSLAAVRKFRASCLLTVSDLIGDPDHPKRADDATIEKGVGNIVEIALESVFALSDLESTEK